MNATDVTKVQYKITSKCVLGLHLFHILSYLLVHIKASYRTKKNCESWFYPHVETLKLDHKPPHSLGSLAASKRGVFSVL